MAVKPVLSDTISITNAEWSGSGAQRTLAITINNTSGLLAPLRAEVQVNGGALPSVQQRDIRLDPGLTTVTFNFSVTGNYSWAAALIDVDGEGVATVVARSSGSITVGTPAPAPGGTAMPLITVDHLTLSGVSGPVQPGQKVFGAVRVINTVAEAVNYQAQIIWKNASDGSQYITGTGTLNPNETRDLTFTVTMPGSPGVYQCYLGLYANSASVPQSQVIADPNQPEGGNWNVTVAAPATPAPTPTPAPQPAGSIKVTGVQWSGGVGPQTATISLNNTTGAQQRIGVVLGFDNDAAHPLTREYVAPAGVSQVTMTYAPAVSGLRYWGLGLISTDGKGTSLDTATGSVQVQIAATPAPTPTPGGGGTVGGGSTPPPVILPPGGTGGGTTPTPTPAPAGDNNGMLIAGGLLLAALAFSGGGKHR